MEAGRDLAEDFRYGFDLSAEEIKNEFNNDVIIALADTAPHAICLAALKAVGVE